MLLYPGFALVRYCTLLKTCLTANKTLGVLHHKEQSLAAPEPWISLCADACAKKLAIQPRRGMQTDAHGKDAEVTRESL